MRGARDGTREAGRAAHQLSSASAQPIWETQHACLKRAQEHKNRACPIGLVTKAISWRRWERGLWALLIQLIRGSSVSLGLSSEQSPGRGYEPEQQTALQGQGLAYPCKTGKFTLALQLHLREWPVHLHAWSCQDGAIKGFSCIFFFPKN